LQFAKVAGGEDEESFFVFYLSISLLMLDSPELPFSPFPHLATGLGLPGLFLGQAGFRRKPGQAQARASQRLVSLEIASRNRLSGYQPSFTFPNHIVRPDIVLSCGVPFLRTISYLSN